MCTQIIVPHTVTMGSLRRQVDIQSSSHKSSFIIVTGGSKSDISTGVVISQEGAEGFLKQNTIEFSGPTIVSHLILSLPLVIKSRGDIRRAIY